MLKKNRLRVDFLNVGFGECTVIRLLEEEETTIVIDGGDNNPDIYRKNPYRLTLLEYLQQENIFCIDLLVITHPHIDHIGGIQAIVEDMSIKKVWTNIPLPDEYLNCQLSSSNYKMTKSLNVYNHILETLKRKEAAYINISESVEESINGLNITGIPVSPDKLKSFMTDLHVLYVSKKQEEINRIIDRIDRKLNDLSLMIKISYQGIGMLFTSDITPQKFLIDAEPELIKAEILQAPHHGDVASLPKDFLRKVNPNYLVISADDQFTYSLPSRNIEEYVHGINSNIKILYTVAKDYNLPRAKAHCGIRVEVDYDRTLSYDSIILNEMR